MGEAGTTMARIKGKVSGRDDVAVKVDRVIVNKARMVAAHRGISVAEILSEILRGPVDKAYVQMIRALDEGAK
jgi:hypothetical protein